LGKSPVIEDNGLVIAESGAIVGACNSCDLCALSLTWPEYIIRKYGGDKVKVVESETARVQDLYCEWHRLRVPPRSMLTTMQGHIMLKALPLRGLSCD
jgi:hypothetical protein